MSHKLYSQSQSDVRTTLILFTSCNQSGTCTFQRMRLMFFHCSSLHCSTQQKEGSNACMISPCSTALDLMQSAFHSQRCSAKNDQKMATDPLDKALGLSSIDMRSMRHSIDHPPELPQKTPPNNTIPGPLDPLGDTKGVSFALQGTWLNSSSPCTKDWLLMLVSPPFLRDGHRY